MNYLCIINKNRKAYIFIFIAVAFLSISIVGHFFVAEVEATDSVGGMLVCVKDFGAKGDGTTDDYASILNAYKAVKGTHNVLYFPNGDYYCSKKILLNSACSIMGESEKMTSITFRNCTESADYELWNQRGLITFNADVLSVSNITFRYIADTDTKFTRTKTQTGEEAQEGVLFSILRGNDINIKNCNFWVGGVANPSITCMWLKAEVADIAHVRINGCHFENDTESTVGGCLWMSSHDNNDVRLYDVAVSECVLLKHANDEALSVWGYHVSDVVIDQNDISYIGLDVQNDVLISFGMPDAKRIESLNNIIFTRNRIHVDGKCIVGIKFQLLAEDSNIEFRNNILEGKISKNSNFDCVWFYQSGKVLFFDNNFVIKGGKKISFYQKKYNNKVIMNGNTYKISK